MAESQRPNSFTDTAPVGQLNKYSQEDLAGILAEIANTTRAKLKAGTTNPASNLVKVGPIDLTTAPLNPLALPSPIKAVYIQTATDSTVVVKLVLNTDAGFAVDSALPLSINDSVSFESPIPKAFLTWAAQSGKTATIYVAIDADIRPGKIVSVSSGGVMISEGSGVTTRAKAGLSITAVASIILPALSTRQVETLTNLDSARIYVGDSAVTDDSGAKPGTPVEPGGSFVWKNTAALYAVSQSGVTLTNFARNLET